MRRTWLLVLLGVVALGLAVVGARAHSPWPLAVLHGDLYTLTGVAPEGFTMVAIGANLLVLLVAVALGLTLNRVLWLHSRRLPRALIGYGLAICVVAGGLWESLFRARIVKIDATNQVSDIVTYQFYD